MAIWRKINEMWTPYSNMHASWWDKYDLWFQIVNQIKGKRDRSRDWHVNFKAIEKKLCDRT